MSKLYLFRYLNNLHKVRAHKITDEILRIRRKIKVIIVFVPDN